MSPLAFLRSLSTRKTVGSGHCRRITVVITIQRGIVTAVATVHRLIPQLLSLLGERSSLHLSVIIVGYSLVVIVDVVSVIVFYGRIGVFRASRQLRRSVVAHGGRIQLHSGGRETRRPPLRLAVALFA